MRTDWVEVALLELGPEDRALLELSVVREVSDDDIASLLGVDAARVQDRREEALERVVGQIGEGGPDDVRETLRGLADARWRSPDDTRTHPAPPAAPVPPPAADDGPGGPSRAVRPVFVAALVIAALAALMVKLSGKDDVEPGPGSRPAPASGTAGEPGARRLAPLAGGPATGTIRVVRHGQGSRLRLRVLGLPSPRTGGYVAWLYNSVSDARPLGGQLRGTFSLDAPLPADYKRYRFVDISREPADGNRNHSGESVLRTPLR